MRFKIIYSSFICLSCFFAKAQSPDKLSSQAVIRNSNGRLVANQSVGLQMSILQGGISGSSVYSETQSSTTNSNGLLSIEIGGGMTTDDFSSIDWSNGPYTMHAMLADTVLNAPDTSSNNEIQSLRESLTGDTLFLSKGNYVIVSGISFANNKVWNKTYGESNREEANNIQITDDGGYILVGHTLGSSDGDVTDENNGIEFFSNIWTTISLKILNV